MNHSWIWIPRAAGVAVIVAVATILMLHSEKPGVPVAHAALGDQGSMPELSGAVGWLNSAPLTRESLRGKVVMVNFWTYSCINSLRELPYVKAWAAKYKDAGLIVIGAHTPEFGFEKERANVENAVRELKITFSVPIDSEHRIWNAFNNEAWPADYFIDAKGRTRYRHYGEGEYDKSERVIQELLRENGAKGVDTGKIRVVADGAEAPPSDDIRSPETYVGYARTEKFASLGGMTRDSAKSYSLPARPSLNQWGLGGSWKVGAENAVLEQASGKIVFRFHSRDLHMVLAPPKNGNPVRFRVMLDGTAPGEDRGVDVNADGGGELRQPRMYQLIRQKGPVRDRLFEIEFLDRGAQAFSFTFG
ncbi:MAG TPA: redoxin domain-containing protein [Candidatus Binatia bacterium]|jgi:thiol-disulfide isomerase/thioredoxin